MKKIIGGVVIIFFCAHFSSQQSTEGREKPSINFYGILVNSQGKELAVEHITIAGLYKQIPVYGVPAVAPEKKSITQRKMISEEDNGFNPTTDTTFIDLDETLEIRPARANPRDGIVTYNNRSYIEIIIVSADDNKTENNYLIDTNRKVWCDLKNQAGPIEKEISFESIKKLIIQGNKPTERASERRKLKTSETSAAKDALCSQAKQSLDRLETTIEKSPDAHISKEVEQLKQTVNQLCQ